jgi:5-(hydroxymethyl)furfural/furfural oxidase
MGRADDPLAVTTGDGRVIGVAHLRVCDASLMPSIPCANTNVPTLMIAERIADLIRGDAVDAAEPADAGLRVTPSCL